MNMQTTEALFSDNKDTDSETSIKSLIDQMQGLCISRSANKNFSKDLSNTKSITTRVYDPKVKLKLEKTVHQDTVHSVTSIKSSRDPSDSEDSDEMTHNDESSESNKVTQGIKTSSFTAHSSSEQYAQTSLFTSNTLQKNSSSVYSSVSKSKLKNYCPSFSSTVPSSPSISSSTKSLAEQMSCFNDVLQTFLLPYIQSLLTILSENPFLKNQTELLFQRFNSIKNISKEASTNRKQLCIYEDALKMMDELLALEYKNTAHLNRLILENKALHKHNKNSLHANNNSSSRLQYISIDKFNRLKSKILSTILEQMTINFDNDVVGAKEGPHTDFQEYSQNSKFTKEETNHEFTPIGHIGSMRTNSDTTRTTFDQTLTHQDINSPLKPKYHKSSLPKLFRSHSEMAALEQRKKENLGFYDLDFETDCVNNSDDMLESVLSEQ